MTVVLEKKHINSLQSLDTTRLIISESVENSKRTVGIIDDTTHYKQWYAQTRRSFLYMIDFPLTTFADNKLKNTPTHLLTNFLYDIGGEEYLREIVERCFKSYDLNKAKEALENYLTFLIEQFDLIMKTPLDKYGFSSARKKTALLVHLKQLINQFSEQVKLAKEIRETPIDKAEFLKQYCIKIISALPLPDQDIFNNELTAIDKRTDLKQKYYLMNQLFKKLHKSNIVLANYQVLIDALQDSPQKANCNTRLRNGNIKNLKRDILNLLYLQCMQEIENAPAYIIQPRQAISANKTYRRQWKKRLKPVSRIASFLLAVGQGAINVVACISVFTIFMNPSFAIPLAFAFGIATFIANYILVIDDTQNTLVRLGVDFDFFNGFKTWRGKTLMIIAFFLALITGTTIGIVTFMSFIALPVIPFLPLAYASLFALITGIIMGIAGVICFSSMMYVALSKTTKLIDDFFEELDIGRSFSLYFTQLRTVSALEKFKLIISTAIKPLVFLLMAFLSFVAVTTTLGAYFNHMTNFMVKFLHLSTPISQYLAGISTFALVGIVRSTFTVRNVSIFLFEISKYLINSTFKALNFTLDKITLLILHPKSFLKEVKFSLSRLKSNIAEQIALMKHDLPLFIRKNTLSLIRHSWNYLKYGFFYLMVGLNGFATSMLSVGGAKILLKVIPFPDLAGKIITSISATNQSVAANGVAVHNNQIQEKPIKVPAVKLKIHSFWQTPNATDDESLNEHNNLISAANPLLSNESDSKRLI